MGKNKTVIILILLTITAFVLRWFLMPDYLFFGPEQGRDFLVIKNIVVGHKLTLIGSKTDISGIFHGPIFYYLAAIPFFFSHGDPVAVLAFFVIVQSVSVFLAYRLAYEITGRKLTGYIAATVFAVSYGVIVYARWLSNPPLSIPLSMVFMLFLLRVIRGKPRYLIAVAVVFGLLGQAEFINFLLFSAIGILILFVNRNRIIKIKPVIWLKALAAGLLTSLATYVLFDIRHDFLITKGVINLLQGKSAYQLPMLGSTLGAFRVLMEQAAQLIGLSGWQTGFFVTVSMILATYKRVRTNPAFFALIIWILLPAVIFAVLRHGMLTQLYAGIVSGFIILLALAIDRMWQVRAGLGGAFLILVVILNCYSIFHNLPANAQVFYEIEQPAVRYTDQLAVIHWVYTRAAGRPFEFQAYTIPYFLQDGWIYMFDQYGQSAYGYAPTPVDRKLLYVVVQKDRLDPGYQKKWYEHTVSAWGVKTDSTAIGEYTVEERVPFAL